jgi:hypothetical protein
VIDSANREAEFQSYLDSSEPYVAAVHAAGNLMWFEKLSDDPAVQLELRRELFMRRHKKGSTK